LIYSTYSMRPVSHVRRARAEAVLETLRAWDFVELTEYGVRALRERIGLTPAQIDAAVDDLATVGLAAELPTAAAENRGGAVIGTQQDP
jgi:uncharacterized protein (UPF0210 family)